MTLPLPRLVVGATGCRSPSGIALADVFATLGSTVRAIHQSDNDGAHDLRLLPGDGTIRRTPTSHLRRRDDPNEVSPGALPATYRRVHVR